ncbi:hypothetical protein PR202_ga22331 [Eleusine coracana subsp. coracana]|uniref:CASP-like protein n=1 Tax=Eleusine coracana subsp. coracana TaxID=191504 RepID=A0AAV5D3B4_ELECO|nr:hypothetical protein QOZ80_9AG0687300 [Eleusine coracana subsp. coracana]GJN04759.1 hypothetical protein PR202_ga22331 [Eleusine coracana subsp. coracana]
MHGSCHGADEEHNGSKAVSLLFRLAALTLALTSAVIMATASSCTIFGRDGTSLTITFKDYPPFVYLVWFNIVAAILVSAGIYLQLAGKGEDDDEGPKLPRIILVIIDVAAQALLYSATGAVFAAETAYGPQINACSGTGGRFCDQVQRSKLFSLGASISISLVAVAKDVALPFSVWPLSSSD